MSKRNKNNFLFNNDYEYGLYLNDYTVEGLYLFVNKRVY